jgi:hypothetical protein
MTPDPPTTPRRTTDHRKERLAQRPPSARSHVVEDDDMPFGARLSWLRGVVRARGSAHVSRLRCMPRVGDYFQRLMKSTIAVLTASGFVALRKC